jgi:ATP-dependent DNA helicase RecQ
MITLLRHLQNLVLSGEDAAPIPETADPFLVRVHSALRGLRQSDQATGPSDLAGLLRQGVLRSHLARGDVPELRVPRGGAWPDERAWRAFGCDVRSAGTSHFRVEPQSWSPIWLDAEAFQVIDATMSEKPRRQARLVPADPRLTELAGYDRYTSPGQREAVRAAFLMPGGATSIVSLPTGEGKTLVFQLPALAWAAQGGLTLVVVPTVALAREQEERYRVLAARQGGDLATRPLAYHAGLSEEAKRVVRDAVRSGSLPILFTSPEAALGALRRPLIEAARAGRLRYFVLDEAHIVSHWGQTFRPEFQSLAGLRTALLGACPTGLPFRTLLLTATLTSESYHTLRLLFGGEDCHLVSEVSLRPEPGFLLYLATTEEERCSRVLEAMRYLPRPIILYTTLRDHALAWYYRLSEAGFRRLRLVRGGDLADSEGEQLLRAWRERAVDIIVATSAFGLGVDQGDVRSIVHACLPETIDRYYQEVGRGGRDGNASLALLITTRGDFKTARALAEETIISVDRGFERWMDMWVRRQNDENGASVVSLDARPADIGVSSERNASWNLRTLVLMAQAGLIEFAAHLPPILEPIEGEDDAAFEARRRSVLDRFAREVALRLRDPGHSERDHWNDVVFRTRQALRDSDRQGYRMLEELHDLRRPLNDIFRDVYTLRDPLLLRPPRLFGSCPFTRSQGTVDFGSLDPEVTTLLRTCALTSPTLEQALSVCRDDSGRCWVAYEPPGEDARPLRQWRDSIFTLLRQAVVQGVVELSLPEGFISEEEWYRLLPRAPFQFLIRAATGSSIGESLASDTRYPRLTLLDVRSYQPKALAYAMQLSRPRHILVLPRGVPDPRRPTRSLFDLVPHLSLSSLLEKLAS